MIELLNALVYWIQHSTSERRDYYETLAKMIDFKIIPAPYVELMLKANKVHSMVLNEFLNDNSLASKCLENCFIASKQQYLDNKSIRVCVEVDEELYFFSMNKNNSWVVTNRLPLELNDIQWDFFSVSECEKIFCLKHKGNFSFLFSQTFHTCSSVDTFSDLNN